jgi:hypothetical protein
MLFCAIAAPWSWCTTTPYVDLLGCQHRWMASQDSACGILLLLRQSTLTTSWCRRRAKSVSATVKVPQENLGRALTSKLRKTLSRCLPPRRTAL